MLRKCDSCVKGGETAEDTSLCGMQCGILRLSCCKVTHYYIYQHHFDNIFDWLLSFLQIYVWFWRHSVHQSVKAHVWWHRAAHSLYTPPFYSWTWKNGSACRGSSLVLSKIFVSFFIHSSQNPIEYWSYVRFYHCIE